MSNEATPLPVEILSAEHVTPPAILAKARKAARKVQSITESAVRSYFELCECLREVPPHEARKILVEEGFNKVRASEILRVSHTTPELFAEYKDRAIGFKLALSKAREISAGSATTGGDDSGGADGENSDQSGEVHPPKPKAGKSEQERFSADLLALVAKYYPAAGPVAEWQKEPREITHGEHLFYFGLSTLKAKKSKTKNKNK